MALVPELCWAVWLSIWLVTEIIERCSDFVELTGEQGDVVLMHPFMLHAFSVSLISMCPCEPRCTSLPLCK